MGADPSPGISRAPSNNTEGARGTCACTRSSVTMARMRAHIKNVSLFIVPTLRLEDIFRCELHDSRIQSTKYSSEGIILDGGYRSRTDAVRYVERLRANLESVAFTD